MRSFNCNLNSCSCLRRSQMSLLSVSWSFKFSRFVCCTISVRQCCHFFVLVHWISGKHFFYSMKLELDLTIEYIFVNTFHNSKNNGKEHIRFIVLYFFQQFHKLVMIHSSNVYINDFNNCTYDMWHTVCFRKLSTNISRSYSNIKP